MGDEAPCRAIGVAGAGAARAAPRAALHLLALLPLRRQPRRRRRARRAPRGELPVPAESGGPGAAAADGEGRIVETVERSWAGTCWRRSRSTRRRRTRRTPPRWASGCGCAGRRTRTWRKSSRGSWSPSPRWSTRLPATPSSRTSPMCAAPRESHLGPRRRPRPRAVPRESRLSALPNLAESETPGAAAHDLLPQNRGFPRVCGAASRGDSVRRESVPARGEFRELREGQSETHRGSPAGMIT